MLQEYFVPVGKLEEFVPKMAGIFQKHGAEIANVSIRHAKKDPGTLLGWAREEVFAYVVYYRQGLTPAASDASARYPPRCRPSRRSICRIARWHP